MKTRMLFALSAGLMLALRFAAAPDAVADSTPPVTKINVDDIGVKATLIGRLGKPLGTMVTVKGKWSYPDGRVKDYSLRFAVSHVNDEKLDEPVEFNIAQVIIKDRRGRNMIPNGEVRKQLDGRTWTLKAFETGRIHITPPEYYTAIGLGPSQTPYWASAFTSEVIGVLQPQ